MPEQPKNPNVIQLLLRLQHHEEIKRQAVDGTALDPQLALLRRWQADRLARTYADLLADPVFAPACRFFLTDIYAARDFSQRDQDFERLYNILSRFLPPPSLQLLHDGLELNRFSHALDARLLQALVGELGVKDSITPQLYAEAYRICDNYAERALQIEQMARILREVGTGARLPLVGVSLKMAGAPAKAAGWIELHDFLERGYAAFRPLKDLETFVGAIEGRETLILKRIFSRDEDPFQAYTH